MLARKNLELAAKIKELAANGVTAIEIAAELGISRTRVYQIGYREGVSFRRVRKIAKAKKFERGRDLGIPQRGRDLGIPRKIKKHITDAILAAGGVSPLEYMLSVMRNENEPPERRDDMAKAAAPYVHARLQSVEVKSTVKHERTDWSSDELVAFLNDCRASREGAVVAPNGSGKPN